MKKRKRDFVRTRNAEHPERWRHLACLVNRLTKLKSLIEDPEEKEVSWESPWTETRYYVKLKGTKRGEKRGKVGR